jgi:hypothetical protein
LLDEDVLILAGKIKKLSATFVLFTFPESVPTEVSIEFSNGRSFRTEFQQSGRLQKVMAPKPNVMGIPPT